MDETLPCMDLPSENACTHRNWYVRSAAYKTLIKHFQTLTPSSSEWDRYKNLMGTIAAESSPPLREQALEVVLLFTKRYDKAAETSYDVINSLLYKIPGSSKSRAKELLVQIILQYVEIGSSVDVIDQLLKAALGSHTANVPTSCLRIITKILSEFGPKPFDIKYIIDSLPDLQDRNDQEFRSALKSLIIELNLWLGPNILPNIRQILSPAEINEVRNEFDGKINNRQMKPSRFTVNEMKNMKNISIPAVEVNLLRKLDQSFYEKLHSNDWSSRRDALIRLQKILDNSEKLQPANFEPLLNSLKKIITEDQCVIVVGLAIRCIAGIAKGLQQNFSSHAVSTCRILLEKFVEKRQHITDQLREALDVVTSTTPFESLIRTINGFLDSKNPTVRFETIHLLFQLFHKSNRQTLRRPEFIALYKSLVKCLHHSQLIIREKSLIALGVALAIAGEGVIMPHLVNVDSYTKMRIRNYISSNDFVEGKYNEIKYRNVAKIEKKRNEEHMISTQNNQTSVIFMSDTGSKFQKKNATEMVLDETLSVFAEVSKSQMKISTENLKKNKHYINDEENSSKAMKNDLAIAKSKSSGPHKSLEVFAINSKVNNRMSDSDIFVKNNKKNSAATLPNNITSITKSTLNLKKESDITTSMKKELIISDDFILKTEKIDKNLKKNAVTENLLVPQSNRFPRSSNLKSKSMEEITTHVCLKYPFLNNHKSSAKSSYSADNLLHNDENLYKLKRKVTSECNILTEQDKNTNLSLTLGKENGRLFLLQENHLKQLLDFKSNHGNLLSYGSVNTVFNLRSHKNLINRSGRFFRLAKKSTERQTQTVLEYSDLAMSSSSMMPMGRDTEWLSVITSSVVSTQTQGVPVEERGTNPYRTRRFSRGTQGIHQLQLEMQTQTPFVETKDTASGPIKGKWSPRDMSDDVECLPKKALPHRKDDTPVNMKTFMLKQVKFREPSRKEQRRSPELRKYESTGTDPYIRSIQGTKKTVEINTITVTRSSEPFDKDLESRKPHRSHSNKPGSCKTQHCENGNVDERLHEGTFLNSKGLIKTNIRGNRTVHTISDYNLSDSMDENKEGRISIRNKTIPTCPKSAKSMKVKKETVFNKSEKKIRFDSKDTIIRLEHRRSKSEGTSRKRLEQPIINRVKFGESEIPLLRCPMPRHNRCRPTTIKNRPNPIPYNTDSSIESFRIGCTFLPLMDNRASTNWKNHRNKEVKLRSRARVFKPDNSKIRENIHIANQVRRISSHPKQVGKRRVHRCNSAGDGGGKRMPKRRNQRRNGLGGEDAGKLDPQTKRTILREIMTAYNMSQTALDDLVEQNSARPTAILHRVTDHKAPPEPKRDKIIRILKPCIIL